MKLYLANSSKLLPKFTTHKISYNYLDLSNTKMIKVKLCTFHSLVIKLILHSQFFQKKMITLRYYYEYIFILWRCVIERGEHSFLEYLAKTHENNNG